MKKLILLELALLFLATTFSSNPPPPGWYQQALPVNDFVNDIFFLDSLTGWVGTLNNGYILKTTNGGNNWDIQMDSAGSLYAVQFLDSQTGYVLGNGLHGIIYKTTNGGLNWNLIHDFSPAGLFRDMSFVNKDTGWVTSIDPFDGGLFKTTNGGTIWQRQLDQTYEPSKVFFINSDTGWISSHEQDLFRTNNGGLNWTLQFEFPVNPGLLNLFFIGKGDTGYIVGGGEGTSIKKSTNGGFNWFSSNNSKGGKGIYFINNRQGWICDVFSTMQKTTDGGLTWINQYVPNGAYYTVILTDSSK